MSSDADDGGRIGKVAIVTGASRGIGRATALELARRGSAVALVQRGDAADVIAEVQASGGTAWAMSADLEDSEQVGRIVPAVLERFGRVDTLVANAGLISRQPAVDITTDVWRATMALNLGAVFQLSQAVGGYLLGAGARGKIIHVASILAFQGGYHVAAYAAAKGGVVQLTRALANEWAANGINVNAVAPGYIDNEITEPIKQDAARYESITRRIPAGRWGTNEEIALAIAFLAGPDSDYVHGHVLAVDGGWLGR